MARSVVLNRTVRCGRCLHPPRWCICAFLHQVACPFDIDVLMHHREMLRPTSTGHLITRLVPSARRQVYEPGHPPNRADVVRPGADVWVLHPRGEPIPAGPLPEKLQVILLDGSWKQSAGMARAVSGWGRRICLPMTGASRYWLRSQQEDGPRSSTVEALLFLLQASGHREAYDQLRIQFELHVYAGLCVRGNKALAERFLESSPLVSALPAAVGMLSGSRQAD